jgi:hypothetical protein
MTRRMVETAAHLVEQVVPREPRGTLTQVLVFRVNKLPAGTTKPL